MKLILSILLLALCNGSIGQVPDSLKFKSLDPYYFHLEYLKEDKAILIDVREPFEFRKVRLNDAINIPSSGNLELSADTLNKDFSLFLYCSTDFRSKRVAKYFYEKGFLKLYSLDGGIVAWKKEGYPVKKKRPRAKDKGIKE